MNTLKRKNYKKTLLLALLLLLLTVGSCNVWNYYNQDSSVDEDIDAETEIVEDTEDLVDELQQLIDAKDAGEEVDEDLIEKLVVQIAEQTETEIETLIDSITETTTDTDNEEPDPEAVQAVSDQIDQLQTDLLKTFEEALDVVESEEIAGTIEEIIDTVIEDKEEIATILKEEAQGEPDQPETVPGEATQEEQPEDAPGEPVQTNQPEIVPEVPTQNKTINSQGENK
jgi:hypothetical protein